MKTKLIAALYGLLVVASSPAVAQPAAQAGARKPNILVIMGDDIGINNVSAFGRPPSTRAARRLRRIS